VIAVPIAPAPAVARLRPRHRHHPGVLPLPRGQHRCRRLAAPPWWRL